MNKRSSEISSYVGLVTPATDSTIEDDLHRLCPDVHVCTERMILEDVSSDAEIKMVGNELPRSARILASLPLDLVVFGCTSASIAGGDAADDRIKETLIALTGARPITVFGSVTAQLLESGVKQLLVITPYPEPLTAEICVALERKGIHVANSISMGLTDDLDIGRVEPAAIVEIVSENWSTAYDGLFLSCTNLRAAEVADGLEKELGVPVVTSNLATARAIHAALESRLVPS